MPASAGAEGVNVYSRSQQKSLDESASGSVTTDDKAGSSCVISGACSSTCSSGVDTKTGGSLTSRTVMMPKISVSKKGKMLERTVMVTLYSLTNSKSIEPLT
eukprot:scaffold645_cov247-Pinguiococcus_pyrenoidosus.AAC.14